MMSLYNCASNTRKGTFGHLRKMSSLISLRRLRRLIKDDILRRLIRNDTFRLYAVFSVLSKSTITPENLMQSYSIESRSKASLLFVKLDNEMLLKTKYSLIETSESTGT